MGGEGRGFGDGATAAGGGGGGRGGGGGEVAARGGRRWRGGERGAVATRPPKGDDDGRGGGGGGKRINPRCGATPPDHSKRIFKKKGKNRGISNVNASGEKTGDFLQQRGESRDLKKGGKPPQKGGLPAVGAKGD